MSFTAKRNIFRKAAPDGGDDGDGGDVWMKCDGRNLNLRLSIIVLKNLFHLSAIRITSRDAVPMARVEHLISAGRYALIDRGYW